MLTKNCPFPYRQIIFGLILILLLIVYIQAIPDAYFHYDESPWIHTSIYWEIFLSEPSTSLFCWTLTQPPVTRYIIGIGRKLQGIDADQLGNPWDFEQSYEENVANNCLPSQVLLSVSRFPMAILAAITGVIIFGIIWDGYGILAALFFVLFYAFNNYLKTVLVQAMGESPLFFFLTLSAFFLMLAIRGILNGLENDTPDKNSFKFYILFSLSGITCGLAGASKINGLLACVSIVLIVLTVLFLFPSSLDKNQKIKFAVRIIFTIAFSTILTFVLINPYLYSNPIAGIGKMYKFRLQEMTIQIAGFPESHIDSLSERISILFTEVFDQYMPFHWQGAGYFYFGSVLFGAITLIIRLRNWLHAKKTLPVDIFSGNYFSPLSFCRVFNSPKLGSVLVTMCDGKYDMCTNWYCFYNEYYFFIRKTIYKRENFPTHH